MPPVPQRVAPWLVAQPPVVPSQLRPTPAHSHGQPASLQRVKKSAARRLVFLQASPGFQRQMFAAHAKSIPSPRRWPRPLPVSEQSLPFQQSLELLSCSWQVRRPVLDSALSPGSLRSELRPARSQLQLPALATLPPLDFAANRDRRMNPRKLDSARENKFSWPM